MVGGSTDSGTRQRIDTSVRNFTLRNSGVLRKEKGYLYESGLSTLTI